MVRFQLVSRSPSVHLRVGCASTGPDTLRAMTDIGSALDEAPLGKSHLRAVAASGMGFFTDAYDLFVIGVASALITKDWNLSSGRLALLNSTMLFAAFIGAFVFGRFADVIGRKRVYWIVAAIMIAGALGSALSPSYWVLIGFRFVL